MPLASRFLRTSAIYFVGTALSKVVGFLLLPIYTALLSPREFGEFDFWTNLIGFLAPIAFFQVWDATYRLHFRADNDRSRVASNGAVLMLAGLGTYLVSVLPFLYFSNAPFPLLTLAYGASLSVQYFLGYFARADLKNSLFMMSGMLNTLVNAGVSLAFLNAGQGVVSLFVGLVAGNVAQSVVLAIRSRPDRWIHWANIDRRMQGALLRFALPLCLTSASYWMLSGFARLEVLYFRGAEANGLLAVGFRFGLVVSAMTTVLVYAWNELLYTVHEEELKGEVQGRGAWIAVRAGLLGTALTVLGAHVLFDVLVSDSFHSGRELVPIVIVATSLNSIATLVGSIFMAEGNTTTLLWSTLLAAAVNVGLGWWSVSTYGAMGAAVVLALSFLAMLTWRLVALRKRYGLSVVDRGALWPLMAVLASLAAFFNEDLAPTVAAGLAIAGSTFVTVRSARQLSVGRTESV